MSVIVRTTVSSATQSAGQHRGRTLRTPKILRVCWQWSVCEIANDRRNTCIVSGLLCCLVGFGACATAPDGRYGVSEVTIRVRDESEELTIAEDVLKSCLLTRERPYVSITLGLGSPTCGEPPFDSSPPTLRILPTPFADYQAYNPAVVLQDEQRIERLYQARGYYDAEVVEVITDPAEAAWGGGGFDTATAQGEPQCNPDEETCPVALTFVVHQGKPVRVTEVTVEGHRQLPSAAAAAVDQVPLPTRGEPLDEYVYDQTKAALTLTLEDHGYGKAQVDGAIHLDRVLKRARLVFSIKPGERYRVGEIQLKGHGHLPAAPIIAACDIVEGELYRPSLLEEAQEQVFALGAFSSVKVEPVFRDDRKVDLAVEVTPLADSATRLGIGVMSGGLQRTDTGTLVSYPQWDVHLLARHEQRHVFGTLGRIRIEERPRLIFQGAFPETDTPGFGNILQLRNDQPAVLERHTVLVTSAKWDVGPEPYLHFRRHNVELRTALQRPLLRRQLLLTLALQQDVFLVTGGKTSDGSPLPASYGHRFLEQEARLSLRDRTTETREGFYLGLLSRQSLKTFGADFSTLHLGADIRGYIPLPWSMVLAARLVTDHLFIWKADVSDAESRELGPLPYRPRGGGANGNRGFLPGELGAGPRGGLRRLEGSVELRMRLGESFGMVLFGDMGDVKRDGPLSLALPNPAVGFGLRYRTPIGPIRFDVGFRVGRNRQDAGGIPLLKRPGAAHLTIGEAF